VGDHTIKLIAERVAAPQLSTADDDVRAIVRDCDAKLDRYRAALDAGADPAVVTAWISQTQAERARAHARLQDGPATAAVSPMTIDEISELVESVGDLATALGESADRAAVYQQAGLWLTYDPETRTAHAHMDLGQRRWDLVGVRGPTLTRCLRHPVEWRADSDLTRPSGRRGQPSVILGPAASRSSTAALHSRVFVSINAATRCRAYSSPRAIVAWRSHRRVPVQ
jgi:hypothetical protein